MYVLKKCKNVRHCVKSRLVAIFYVRHYVIYAIQSSILCSKQRFSILAERKNMITTKNRIGYIQRRYDENNIPHFKFIVAKIKRVNIGVKSTKVYTKEFYPLDLEDLESTTEILDTSKGIIIVQEPFILKDDEEEYFQAVVDKWNEEPPKSIFE